MGEDRRKRDYLKRVEEKKLKRSQEFKTLNFSSGATVLVALLFLLNGYDLITKEVSPIMLILAGVFLAEGAAQYIMLFRVRKKVVAYRDLGKERLPLAVTLLAFLATGNIFAAISGFTLINKRRTLEYTMTIYCVINSIAIIMVTSLNLFKEYVANTFLLGFYTLLGLTVFYLVCLILIALWDREGVVDKKLLPVAVLMIASSLVGNVFALLAGMIIISRYRHQGQDRSIDWIDMWERLFRNNMAVIGMLVVVFLLSLSITSSLTFDYGIAIDNNYSALLQPISLEYPFGTDNFGRCVFTRIVFGARISLVIGICVTIVPMVIGGILGALAGYYGKRVDNVIMRLLDIQYAVPDILLAIAIIAAFGASTVNLVIALSVGMIAIYARTVRATVLSIGGSEFVEAAKACGARDHIVIFKHIIPNSLAPIIVRATMGIGTAVLSTSSLSYLGLGVEPYIPEWGNILKVGSKYLESHPHLAIFPGIAIIVLVLAFNFFGDGLRDALDPKLK